MHEDNISFLIIFFRLNVFSNLALAAASKSEEAFLSLLVQDTQINGFTKV